MLAIKYLLEALGVVMMGGAAVMLILQILQNRRSGDSALPAALPVHGLTPEQRNTAAAGLLGLIPLLIGLSMTVVPAGMAGVRVSQWSGTLPGTLYPGFHLLVPLVHKVELYDARDRVYHTVAAETKEKPGEVLQVQTREGLLVGLAASVRYRVDPSKLDYIHAALPHPLDMEVVRPLVAGVFREETANYLVQELVSTKRAELLEKCREAIAVKLASDQILLKEVMIRDLLLPSDYLRGMEGLLLKVQENERLTIELEVKQKEVQTAELEAEAQRVRRIKEAEGAAQITVLQAKAQADAMQHTLPLKEKQIQQTRLEAEARKESTVKNAEAAALAKVIDGKAELEKRKLMSEADEHRTRLMAKAEAERMALEAEVLKQNPMLIQKIIAERLSDKVQIMMVPMDGKFFFANDVLRGFPLGAQLQVPE
jgi:regulator of protease activity HflC (stomatin/prohibitin superfamily)